MKEAVLSVIFEVRRCLREVPAVSPSTQATTSGLWGSNDTTECVETAQGRFPGEASMQAAQPTRCERHLELKPSVLKPRLLSGAPALTPGALPSSQQALGFPLN